MPKLTSSNCKNGKEIYPAICTNMGKSTSTNDGHGLGPATRDPTCMTQGNATIYAVNRIKSRLTTKDDSTCGSLPKIISRMDDEKSSNSNSTVQPVFQNSKIPNYSNSTSNTNEYFFILPDTLKVESSTRSSIYPINHKNILYCHDSPN